MQATYDSIHAALGIPERVVDYTLNAPDAQGFFDSRMRGIAIDTRNTPADSIPGIYAHELAHQATTAESMSGEVDEFLSAFMAKWDSLDFPAKRRHFESYYGDLGPVVDSSETFPTVESLVGAMEKYRLQSAELHEVIASTLERGYNMARRADRSDPSKGRDERRQAEKDYPGTADAFNFFMRAFAGMPK